MQVYVRGKVESCLVAADLIEMIQVFSWTPYCWILKANFSFRILLLKKQGTEWSLKKPSFCMKRILFITQHWSSLANGRKGESARTRVKGWDRESLHPHECRGKHWTVHSNGFKSLKTLWSACLGPTSEVCASCRAVNYQLWVLETASRPWARAGEPCVLCCPSCWISNKCQSITNCPLFMLLMVLRLITVPRLDLPWVTMFLASLPQITRLTPGWANKSERTRRESMAVMTEPREWLAWILGYSWLPRIGHFAEIYWRALWMTDTTKELLSLRNPGIHHSHICLESVNDYYTSWFISSGINLNTKPSFSFIHLFMQYLLGVRYVSEFD